MGEELLALTETPRSHRVRRKQDRSDRAFAAARSHQNMSTVATVVRPACIRLAPKIQQQGRTTSVIGWKTTALYIHAKNQGTGGLLHADSYHPCCHERVPSVPRTKACCP